MGVEPPPHIARIPSFITALPIVLFLDPGPLGEELGWRGFALPRMAERFGLPLASTMLGLIWGAWHYPVFRIPSMNQSSLSFPVFVVGAIVMSFIIAWLVLRTGGSVLIAVLFHLAVNLSLGVFQPPFPMLVVVLGVVALSILAFDPRFRTSRSVESVVP
jgi:membrane protease YdiL (CAAX protease family)